MSRFSSPPLFADDYLLTVLILILYFAYTGPGLEHHDGLCRPAFARPRALCRARRLYARRRSTCISASVPGSACWSRFLSRRSRGAFIGFLAFRFGVAGVYFAILTIAFAEFARIGFDHFGWANGSAGLFLPVAQYARNDLWQLRGHPVMFYYVMLAVTVLAFMLCHALLRSRIGYFWLAIREDEEAARALGIDTSATRCSRW